MKKQFTCTETDVKPDKIDETVQKLHAKAKSRYAESRTVTIQSVSVCPMHSGRFLVCCLFEKKP